MKPTPVSRRCDWSASSAFSRLRLPFVRLAPVLAALLAVGIVPRAAAQSGTWAKTTGGSWGTASNWVNSAIPVGTTGTAFFNGVDLTANATVSLDGVRTIGGLAFGDTTPSHDWILATGSVGPLTLGGTADVRVDNRTATISAVLAGSTGMRKQGAGTLVLTEANTYTGLTQVLAGTLQLAYNNSSGGGGSGTLASSAITIQSGATLSANIGNALGYSGTNWVRTVTLNGGTFIANAVGYDQGWGVAYHLTAGTLNASAATSRFAAGGGTSVTTYASSQPSQISGEFRLRESNTDNRVRFNVAEGAAHPDLAVNGAITSAGTTYGIEKTGGGTMRLSAASTYTGPTVVSEGTLWLTGSLAATTTTVAAGATLKGNGTCRGATTISGTLSPGDESIATLIISNTLSLQPSATTRMEVEKTGTTRRNDAITGVSTLVLGGTLNVSLTAGSDPLAVGDAFTLFSATTRAGSFANLVLPSLSGGLSWDTRLLASQGVITVTKPSQTITFGPLPDATLGDAPFALAGSSSSGLPLTYASSNPLVATVEGQVVTLTGSGVTTLTASQPGNDAFLPATSVSQVLTVYLASRMPQTIDFSPPGSIVNTTPPFVLNASASSGLPLTLTSSNPAVATVTGTTVTLKGNGSTTLTASQPGNTEFEPAASVSQTLTVIGTPQTLTFPAIANQSLGNAPLTLAATTTSGLTISYASSNPAVASISGNRLTPVSTGTVTITASQAGNATYDPATPVTQSLTILPAATALTVSPTPLALSAASGEVSTVPFAIENPTLANADWKLELRDENNYPDNLDGALAAIQASASKLNAPLPDRYDFTEGETGNSILTGVPSGNTQIFNTGNKLTTNIGGPLNYSNNMVASSNILGSGGRYFTSKLPGLFLFGADLNSVSWFEVAGTLYWGNGRETSAFNLSRGNQSWSAFVCKTADYWRTINHLILVDQTGLTQSTSTSMTDQKHRVSGLTGTRRLYYLLYVTSTPTLQPDNVFIDLANRLLDNTPAPLNSTLTFAPATGTAPAEAASNVNATFNAMGQPAGQKAGQLHVLSPGGTLLESVPLTLTVTPPRLLLPPSLNASLVRGMGTTPFSIPVTSNFDTAQPWSASVVGSSSWLSVATSSGTTPDPLKVNINPGSLAAGSYSATITVTSGPATFRIPVHLYLAPLNITKFLPDPNRPRIYAINQNAKETGQVVEINPLTRLITRVTSVGKEPTDLDLTDNGLELRVINTTNPSISRISLADFSVSETIQLTNFSNRNEELGGHIKCGKGSIVYYVDEQWGPRLRVFDLSTRKVLQTFGSESGSTPNTSNDFGYGNINLNPARTRLFGWTQLGDGAGSTGTWVVSFNIKADGTLEGFKRSSGYGSSNFTREPFSTPVLLGNGGTPLVIKDRSILPDSLDQHLTVYPDEIYAMTPGGEVVVTSTAIYPGQAGDALYTLPVTTTVQAVLPDYSQLVYFNATAGTINWLDLVATVGASRLGLVVEPADGSTVAGVSQLKWLPTTGINRYQVYLATSMAELNAATPESAAFLGETNEVKIPLSAPLAAGQTYYWRAVPMDASGQAAGSGTTYAFTAASVNLSRSSISAETVRGTTTHLESIDLTADNPTAWTASANVTWIRNVTPSGTTPGKLDATLDASNLAVGTYQGIITLVTGGGSIKVPVSLRVYAANYTIAEGDLELPYIYVISQESDTATTPSFLLRVHTASNAIESAIPCGRSVTDLAIHYQENRIYLTNWQTGVLRAFDRSTFSQVQTYQFSPPGPIGYGEGGIWRVAAGKRGRVILEEADQWIDIRLIDTANGAVVSSAGGYAGDGEADPSGRFYYHSENLSSMELTRWDLSSDKFTAETAYAIGTTGNVVMIPDGSKIAVSNKVTRPAMDQVITLSGGATTATLHGEVIFTNTKAVNGNSGLDIATLPLTTTVQAVSGDQKKLYQFKAGAFTVTNLSSIITLPPRGLVPGIADNASVLDGNVALSWLLEPVAIDYDVYFGTSADEVNAATRDSAAFLGTTPNNRWTGSLPAMSSGSRYFWRVDFRSLNGTTKGAVWNFLVFPITASPGTLALTTPASAPPPRQSITLTSGTPQAWTASSTTSWITLKASSGTTPATLEFDVNVGGLAPGSYQGTINLQAAGASAPLPVSLTVTTLNVTRLFNHPDRAAVYGLHTALAGEGECFLLEIDPATAAIRRALPVGSSAQDVSFNPGADLCYLTASGSNEVRVVDAFQWQLLPPIKLASPPGLIEATTADQWVTRVDNNGTPLIVWDAATGGKIATGPTVRSGDGRSDWSGSYYYHAESGSSNSTIAKYDLSGAAPVKTATSPALGYGSRNLVLSDDGSRLFWQSRVLDADLNLLGSVPGEVIATTRAGELAVGSNAIWWSDSATTLATLPFSTTLAVVSASDRYLVRYNASARTLHSTSIATLTDLPGPSPRPGQILAASPDALSWSPVDGAVSYRVFLAASATELAAMTQPTATVATPRYALPAVLPYGSYYAWRADAVAATSLVTTGKVQLFGIGFPKGPAIASWGTGNSSSVASLSESHLLLGASGMAAMYSFDPATGATASVQSLSINGYYGDHYFGSAVAMDSVTPVIGAYAYDGPATDCGAAFVYRPSAHYWASSGPVLAGSPTSYAGFGRAVAAKGNLMLVQSYSGSSAAGAVSAYVNAPGTVLTQTFSASDGVANDAFGRVIAIDGNHAVISATGPGSSYNRAPCLYAFNRSTATGLWSQSQKITIPNATVLDSSGRAIALDGNTLATTSQSNAVVICTRASESASWSQSAIINSSSAPGSTSSFGVSLALRGNQLFIGDSGVSNGGAVYPFRRAGSAWVAGPPITPPASATLGVGLAIRDRWLVCAGGSTQPAWLFRISDDSNQTPVFTTRPSTQLVAGRPFNIAVNANDADGNQGLVITKLQGPAWLNLTDHGKGSATLNGTPSGVGGDTHTVQLAVRDGAGSRSLSAWQITLLSATDLPVIAPLPAAAALGTGQEFSLRTTVTGTGPFQYQWYANQVPIDGATQANFVIPEVGLTDSGSYHVRVSNAVGAVDSAVLALAVRPADRFGGDWTTFGNSATHSGRHPAALDSCRFVQAWSVPVQTGYRLNRAVIANGMAYVVPDGYFVTSLSAKALDLATGSIRWTFPFPSSYSSNPPTYYENRIYFQRGKGTGDVPQLFAIDATTGSRVWAATYEAQWESYQAPTVGPEGIFVNGGTYGGLYGFNFDGSRRFFVSLSQMDGWTPALRDGRLFTAVNGLLTEHSPIDGTTLWTLPTTSGTSVPILSGNFAVLQGGPLNCVDLIRRALAWTAAGTFSGHAAVGHGHVFAIQGSTVKSFALVDGVASTSYVATEALSDQPILFNDRLVVAGSSSTWVFDLASGAVVQKLGVTGALSYANGYLLAAAENGTLHAFLATPQPRLAVEADGVPLPAANPVTDFTAPVIGQSTTETYTLRNNGAADLTGIKLDLQGAGAADYAVGTPPPATLAPGASTTFTVTFTPTAPGPRNAVLAIASNDPAASPFAITLSGSGNRVPVFAGYPATTRVNRPLALAAAKIAARATDPDGDSVSLSAVADVGSAGGTATLTAGTLTFTPPANFTGTDTIEVTLTDARGAQTVGMLTVTVAPEPTGAGALGRNLTGFTLEGGRAEMTFRGIPGRTYVIQRSVDLLEWRDLGTVTAGADGRILFTDSSPPAFQGFYRTQSN